MAKKKKKEEKRKKNALFILNLVSPLLPIVVVLIFNKIGHAVIVLVLCAFLFVAVLTSMVSLIRVKEKSPWIKVIGTVMGFFGIVVAALIAFLSGWASTKI
jgi:VIT1/CCC1 family predicted Fe2+/Mn2+ transporter